MAVRADHFQLPAGRATDPQHDRAAPLCRVLLQPALQPGFGTAAQGMGQVDRHPVGPRRGPGHAKRHPGAAQRVDQQEILHFPVIGGVTGRDPGIVAGDQGAFLGLAEAGAAAMFHEEPGRPHVPPAQGAHLLAPVDLFAVAAPEDGVEAWHPFKKGPRHGHAEPDPCGGMGSGRCVVQGGGDPVDPVRHAGGQIAADADGGDREDLGIVRHRGDRGHGGVLQRGQQPGQPAFGDQCVGVQQDHRTGFRRGAGQHLCEPGIHAGDEAAVLVVFYQLDLALGAGCDPVPHQRPHGRIGGGILDQDHPPRALGMAGHTVQAGACQVGGVVDRNDDRDRARNRGIGSIGRGKDRVVQRTVGHGRAQPQPHLDPGLAGDVAPPEPADEIGQQAQRGQAEAQGQAQLPPADLLQRHRHRRGPLGAKLRSGPPQRDIRWPWQDQQERPVRRGDPQAGLHRAQFQRDLARGGVAFDAQPAGLPMDAGGAPPVQFRDRSRDPREGQVGDHVAAEQPAQPGDHDAPGMRAGRLVAPEGVLGRGASGAAITSAIGGSSAAGHPGPGA